MEKEKIINAFKILLNNANYDNLERTKCPIDLYNFHENCKNQLKFHISYIPKNIHCNIGFHPNNGYIIKSAEDIFSIQEIFVNFTSYFNDHELNKFSFRPKNKKFEELSKIYIKHGLIPDKNIVYDSGEYYFNSVTSKIKTYAISYGQILYELTEKEYLELENLYLNKLYDLDKNYINSIK